MGAFTGQGQPWTISFKSPIFKVNLQSAILFFMLIVFVVVVVIPMVATKRMVFASRPHDVRN